jgi:multiple sugar transport system permease protein
MLNSLVVTAGATILAVLASTMAGYAYSRFRHPALAGSAFFLIFIRLIPPIVITLPLFPAVNVLGLNDTHVVLIVLYATFFVSLGTLVMRTFIDQIPREVDEAAFIDGATRGQILRRLIFPLSAQGMVAVAVFVIVYAWNEFLFAFMFTTTRAKTAPLVISEMIGAAEGVEWGVLFAASTVQLLPVLLFVVLAQKHLVAGLTAGATKG